MITEHFLAEIAQLKRSNETLALQRDHWLGVARAKDAQLERIRQERLTWAMACGCECPSCLLLDALIRGDEPRTDPK